MKLNWRAIDEARQNPAAWLQRQSQNGQGFPPKYSFHRFLEHAILRYHTRGNDLGQAHAYLDERYWRHFKSTTQLPRIHQRLDDYAASYQCLHHTYIVGPMNVGLQLPPHLAVDFKVSGLIARLDMTPSGYAAWMFEKQQRDWSVELRMPLIQAAVAAQLGAELDEVEVGGCDLSSAQHTAYCFSSEQVDAAHTELESLLSRLR